MLNYRLNWCRTVHCLNYHDLTLKALINFSFRLLALEFCKEMTAQIAAGIQPIKVICKIKQIIDVIILPLRKKERKGRKMAISVICEIV